MNSDADPDAAGNAVLSADTVSSADAEGVLTTIRQASPRYCSSIANRGAGKRKASKWVGGKPSGSMRKG